MEQITKKFNQLYQTKKGLYILSFILPIAIMLVVWAFMGVYPFGDETLMSVDFGQQYIDFFRLYKRTLWTGDLSNLFYSFSKSIGGTMISNWAYYLMSPFYLIYALLPAGEFRLATTIIIGLRYGFIALSFAHLLIKRYNGHLNDRRFLVPLLSTVYALAGFLVAYQMNIIFYDGMIMLPLVILALEEVLDGGKGYKFALIIALTLFLQYYMGYMICLFVILYTIFYMSSRQLFSKTSLLRILRAAIYAILGAGMVMWLLYPVFMDLLISKGAYGSKLTFEWKMQINPLDALAKLMIGAFDSQSWPAGPNLPNIFVGSLGLFGTGVFFANRSISKKQKIAAVFVFAVFFISIVNLFFNKIWHMGQTPAGFFYRFSWIISFFMVLLTYRGLHNWRSVSWPLVMVSSAFIYLAAEWTYSNEFSFFNFDATSEVVPLLENYLALILRVLIVLFIFSLYKYRHIGRQRLISMIGGSVLIFIAVSLLNHFGYLVKLQTLSLAIWIFVLFVLAFGFKKSSYLVISLLTIFELGLNAYIVQSRMNYDDASKFRDAQLSVLPVIDLIRPSKEGEFYRINKMFERSKNDPFMFDYPGMTHFSSNMERSTLNFMTAVGDSGSNASSFYGNGTAFMDAFYGIRYVVDYQDYTNEDVQQYPNRRFFHRNSTRSDLLDYYQLYWEDERFKIYENQNVLPIAFGVNEQTVNLEILPNQVAHTNNQILSAISGQELQVFKSYLFENIELTNVKKEETASGKVIYKKIDESQKGEIKFTFTPQTDATYYINAPLALKRQKGGKTEIKLNGRWYDYQHSFDGQQLWNIANNQKGQTQEMVLTLGTTKELDLTDMYMITADQSISEQIIANRKQQGMNVTEWGNTFMKGTVNITDDSRYMMTSIPYNQGWTVSVDGQEVPIKETWGAFISFPITKGTHEIEMKFTPDGWSIGWMITGLSIFGLIVYSLLEKNKRKPVVNG